MQTQLFGEQMLLSSFPTQPVPTAAAQQASEERISKVQQEIMDEIEEKQERIIDLKREIGDAEDHIAIVEEDELELEPDDGCEDVVYAEVPQLEADLEYTRYESDAEIKELEKEIAEMEKQLK